MSSNKDSQQRVQEEASNNMKAEEELQDAVACSAALVGEAVMDMSEPTAGVLCAATSTPSFPCLRPQHRSDLSSDDDSVTGGGLFPDVGLLSQGLAWVKSRRESSRRRYLQYQAEEQVRKIKQAQMAEKYGTEDPPGSKGLLSNSIFQNLAMVGGGSRSSGNGGHQSEIHGNTAIGSSRARLGKNHAIEHDGDGEEDVSIEATLSQSGTGYTVELNVSLTEDDDGNEEDSTWIPPVRIEEEELPDEKNPSLCLLNEEQRQQVAQYVLPSGIAYAKWKRVYSLARDGDAFDACLRLVKDYNQTLMIVRTSRNEYFGGFADDSWEQPHLMGPKFFGSAGSCLFSFKDGRKLKAYKWTGANRYIQLTDIHRKLLAFGGGGDEGSFGLCVESDFQRGSTGHCDTFGNDPLCEEENFDIVDLEIFGFLLGQF